MRTGRSRSSRFSKLWPGSQNHESPLPKRSFDGVRRYIDNALNIVNRFDIPVAGCRVHATAWDVCRYEGTEGLEAHRARARVLIMRIADSFDEGEPPQGITAGCRAGSPRI
jgi:hypothetical protein